MAIFCVPKVLKQCKGQRLVQGLKLRKNAGLYANAGVSYFLPVCPTFQECIRIVCLLEFKKPLALAAS